MKPDAKHVKPLESFDASAFADWLRCGFEDLHHEERRLTAFAPLNYFVGHYGDLTSDLKNIYDVLSGSAQRELRFGIARAFSDLPPAQRSVPIVRLLLHLAGRVHAPEIFPEVIKQVGNGFFGMPEHIEGRELFALTLDIVADMSRAHGVGDAVRRLVGSSFFQPGYAPRAFIALCRAEPEKFPMHLELLRGHFTDLHQKEGTDDAFITARRFVQYVDLEIFRRNLWRLYLCIRPDVDALSTDNWLVEALFFDNRAPLISTKDGDDFVIARRAQIQTSMKIHLEADRNVWSDVDDVRRFLNRCLERNRSKMWEEVDMAKVGKKLMFESKDRTHPALTVEQCNMGELFGTNSALYLFPQTDKTRTGIRELSH
jgi:hypothetical protein